MSFKKTPFELIWAPFCRFYGKQEQEHSTAVQNVREN